MLKWPERSKAAIRKLFEPLQDIDVYVEDINDEVFYRCLLQRATNGEVKIAKVFALGGCKAVTDAAKLHDHRLRRALFIVDGDLPWVKGESSPKIMGLHCHDAYCIENLIMCEKALAHVLSQEIVVMEDEANKRLNYRNWVASIQIPLLELFSAFATVNSIDPTVTTVAQGVGCMCVTHKASGITELDFNKVRLAKKAAIDAAEKTADTDTVLDKYTEYMKKLSALPNPLHAVSGKDFLVPLIDFHLQTFGCRIKRKSLRLRLANACDTSLFASLSEALKIAARG